jgi:radical SAM superfamily enzyme YgiQ (UPF0313 family)
MPIASPWRSPAGAAVGLISLYDFENNAVRQLAAGLRARGRRVVEVYFKDWQNNRLDPPSALELSQLVALLRSEGIGLVGVSLRASAYQQVASQICAHVRAHLGVPVMLGGWHVTVRPDDCLAFADALCLGEADRSFPDFVESFFAADGALEAIQAAPGCWVKGDDGTVHKGPTPPLVEDLDQVPWRDYESDDKWVIFGDAPVRGDPMARDPLYQVMCSHGCIQKCSFCHNSFETGQEGARLRVRSVSSVLDELKARRAANPAIRRVRFDDEIFGLDKRWLREFAERYPREVGLPFDLLTEPTVVSEEYADLLAQAGCQVVHMGIQSTEAVNRDTLSRRASRDQTRAAVQRLSDRGMRVRYLVMVDIPGVTPAQKRELFDFLQEVPRPFDVYLFSLTWFPGSRMVEDLLETGTLLPHQVEGRATKTFFQYRADLTWPRSPDDRFWLSLMILQASGLVPRRLLAPVADRGPGARQPHALVGAANLATLFKTARVAARMAREGEMTATLVRRWWSPGRMVTM